MGTVQCSEAFIGYRAGHLNLFVLEDCYTYYLRSKMLSLIRTISGYCREKNQKFKKTVFREMDSKVVPSFSHVYSPFLFLAPGANSPSKARSSRAAVGHNQRSDSVILS